MVDMGMSPRKVGKLLIENHMKGGFKDGMGTKKKGFDRGNTGIHVQNSWLSQPEEWGLD